MASLSERAVLRCEAHILRHFPAWKQCEVRASRDTDALDDFIMASTSHLKRLQHSIANGVETDIDSGWPRPGDTYEPFVEPVQTVETIREVPVEVVREVPVEVERDSTETKERLAAAEAKLAEAQRKIDRRDVPEPQLPEVLSKYAEPGEAAEQTKDRLRQLYTDFTNRWMCEVQGGHSLPRLSDPEKEIYKELNPFFSGKTAI